MLLAQVLHLTQLQVLPQQLFLRLLLLVALLLEMQVQLLPIQQVQQAARLYLHTQRLQLLVHSLEQEQVLLQFQVLQTELVIHLQLQQLMLMEHQQHLLHLTQ
jgi:hypothetical protein